MDTGRPTEFTAGITARMGDVIRIEFGVGFFTAETFIIRHRFGVIVITFRAGPVEEFKAGDNLAVLKVSRVLKNPFL